MIADVVIEAPPRVPPALLELAAARCGVVLGSGRCRVDRSNTEPAAFEASIVALDDNAATMRIELRRADGAPGRVRLRQVTFSALDSTEDRWRSLGVLVAALVVLWDSEAKPTPVIPREIKPVLPPSPRLDGWADLGFANGDLFGWPAVPGVVARGALAYEPWRVFGLVGGRYFHRFARDPRLDVASFDCGFGTRVGPWTGWWALELHAQLEWQRIRVAASAPGRSEARSTIRFGSRLGLDASLRLSGALRAVIGVEAAVLRPEVVVDVHDVVTDRIEAASLGGFVGFRFDL